MKYICYVAVVVCAVSGCQTERSSVDPPEEAPVVFRKEESACIVNQKDAIKKEGFSLDDGIDTLLSFLLDSDQNDRFTVCTKN